MPSLRVTEWQKLPITLAELCLDTTLRCGQSFRWKNSPTGEWTCALHGRILSLRQDSSHLHYRAAFPVKHETLLTPPPSSPPSVVESFPDTADDTLALVEHYLNLTPNLTQFYEQWSLADSNFKKRAPKFAGVRILRQDAWEALVGFICSSNNNIPRISQMVDKLCVNYGTLIGSFENRDYYDFPSPLALCGSMVEIDLRQLGFGYRAKYLSQTAILVAGKPQNWLQELGNPECPPFGHHPLPGGDMKSTGRDGYRQAHEQLLKLKGVGPKVADCVSLMGLGWGEAVPVDTHVWQIAQRDYKFGKGKHRSLTKATYDAIGDHFRSLWGREAGWAHSVLFAADLRKFSDRLKVEISVDEDTNPNVKMEEAGNLEAKLVVDKKVTSNTTIKREFTDEDLRVEETSSKTRSSKRRRVG
ncbi:MAG: 8-oxoguanine glycosylase ogg1 [Trizodia sp. TS-e1964]|nr:MAG: 8-oxoguanine glycosylase ogg1 [Trizodia sp. TS-e1964]